MRMFGRWLTILLLSVAIKQAIFLFILPVWEVPDEPTHVAYVQSLIEQRRLPVYSDQQMSMSQEMFQSLSLIENANPQRLGRHYPPGFVSVPTTDTRRLVADSHPVENLAARNSPIYYLYAGVAYLATNTQPITVRVEAMRIATAILLLLTVWLVVRAALATGLSPATALVVGAVVGWHPAMSAIFAGVNPDGLLILVATWSFLLMVSPVRGSIERRGWLIALVVGLATSIKLEGWFLFIAALIWLSWQRRAMNATAWWRTALLGGLTAVVVGGSWLAIQSLRSPANLATVPITPGAGLDWQTILNNAFFERTAITFRTFWGHLGWSGVSVYSTEWVYGLMLMIAILAGIGSILWLVRSKKNSIQRNTVWLFIASALTLEAFYQFLYWRAGRQLGATNFPVHGRYYLPLILPFALWLVTGLQQLLLQRGRAITQLIVVSATILATVVLISRAWMLYRFERLAGF